MPFSMLSLRPLIATSRSFFSCSSALEMMSMAFSAPLGYAKSQHAAGHGTVASQLTPSSMGVEKNSSPVFSAISLPPGTPGR